jgi:hypothetical protein
MGTPSAFDTHRPACGTQRNLDVFRELGNKKKGCRRKQPLRQAFHNLTNSAAPKYQLFVQRLLLRQFNDRQRERAGIITDSRDTLAWRYPNPHGGLRQQ